MAAPVLHLTSSELHARFKKVTLSPSQTASQTQGIVIACFPLYDEYNMALTICRRLLHKVGILEVRPYTLLTLDMTTYKKRGAGKYHSWSSFVGDVEYRVLQEVSKKGPYCTYYDYYDVFVMDGARAVYVGTSNCVYGLAPGSAPKPAVPSMYIKENDNYSNKTVSESTDVTTSESSEDLLIEDTPFECPKPPTKPPFVPAIPMNKVTPKLYKDMGAM